MKCTLPEPDRSGWQNDDYYEDTISELWEVLNLVKKMREAQENTLNASAIRLSLEGRGLFYKALEKQRVLEHEVDEWFDDFNKQNQR